MNLKYFSVKERIFLIYMYFFAFLTIITVIINTFIKLDTFFNYKWMAVGLFCFVLSIFALKRIHTHIIHRIGVYVMSFILLPYCWIASSGILSPSLAYTPLIFILINYFSRGLERIILNLLEILVVLFLIWLYYNRPEYYNFINPRTQFIDWMAHIPTIFSFLALLLITFEKTYESTIKSGIKRENQLKKLTFVDPLTGLYNRNYMDEQLKVIHSNWRRGNGLYSLIMIDIDFFKLFNDYYGHLRGDQCLKEFSLILQKLLVRDTDTAFRYGGEEFLLILGFTDIIGAEIIAKRIRQALIQSGIPHNKSRVSSMVTVSIGVATVNKSYSSAVELLDHADKALYQAKEQGRNSIVLYKNKSPIHVG